MTNLGKPLALAVALFAIHTSIASAQTGRKRTVGDTLHFHQTMKMAQSMEGAPTGPMTNDLDSDMRLAVLFGNGDTLKVWMEAAKTRMVSPMGEMSPPMDEMLNKPYVMTLGADGKLKTVTAPKLIADDPMGLTSMADDQSFGFDMPMPKEPLRAGLTWSDTTVRKPKEGSPQKMNITAIAAYTVVADSVINGEPVTVIEAKTTSKTDGEMDLGGSGMTMKLKMDDAGTARIYYSRSLGMVIKRTSESNGKGTQAMEGAMSMTLTSSQKMTGTLDLIK